MIEKKLIGKLPVLLGEYDNTKVYNKKQRVTLYGSEFESIIDNNTTAPATLTNDTLTINTNNWMVVSNGTEAFLAGEKVKHFNKEDNPEFIAVDTDNDNKLLSSVNLDGSRTFYHDVNVKRNINIDGDLIVSNKNIYDEVTKSVKKEDSKSLINENVAESLDVKDNPEYIDVKLDSEGKIIAHRDKQGMLHENTGVSTSILTADKASINNLNIGAITNIKDISTVKEAFKKEGFAGIFDFSNEKYLELPVPRVCAKVNFIGNIPNNPNDEADGYLEFIDYNGNYFKKAVTGFAWQGNSSLADPYKGYKFDFTNGDKIKFGNWIAQDSFNLKKYFIDCFRGRSIVDYRLVREIYATRNIGERYPFEDIMSNAYSDTGKFVDNYATGATTVPDGFPILLYNNGKLEGLHVWSLKKDRNNYNMNKSNAKHIILDGVLGISSIWNSVIDWTAFEIRNPKSLKNTTENKYAEGDELSENDSFSKEVKGYIQNLSTAIATIKASTDQKTEYAKHFNVPFVIDYFLNANVVYDSDGFNKNWLWCTWDGIKWTPTIWDKDGIFGMVGGWGHHITPNSDTQGLLGISTNDPSGLMYSLYKSEVIARYKELRDLGIFSVNHIMKLLNEWLYSIGYDNLKTDLEDTCKGLTPSYRASLIVDGWKIVGSANVHVESTYQANHNYNEGDTCIYHGCVIKATKALTSGESPFTGRYETPVAPYGGYFDSPQRVQNWLTNRLAFLDTEFNYK